MADPPSGGSENEALRTSDELKDTTMRDGVASTAAETAETAETEKRRAAEEATARAKGLETQARMKAELEEQLRRAEEAEKLRTELEAAGARGRHGHVVVVSLMVRGTMVEAIKLAMLLQPMLKTAETLRARPDIGTGVQRFDYFHAECSTLVADGLKAKEQHTWCKLNNVEFRFELALRRPAGVRWTEGPRAAPAPARASVPAREGPQPDLYPSGEDKILQGFTGRQWVRGPTTYATAAGAGIVNSAEVLARLAAAEKNIEQLQGAKVRELSLESKERRGLAEELKAATDKGLEQDQKFQALQAEAKGHMAEIASLRKLMEMKNEEIDKFRQEKQVWMSRRHEDCLLDTPPRHFDFSSPAALSTPEQAAHETPTKQLDMFGAGAMASSPQGSDGQPQVPVGRSLPSPKQAAAALSPSQQQALKSHVADLVAALPVPAWLLSPGGQVPIGWTGPRPEATTERTKRQTKEEKAAMRAERLEGRSLESLAVALQGKRPPPTPSPASKVTQEGPSKAAAIEEDSSETDESASGGDDGQ